MTAVGAAGAVGAGGVVETVRSVNCRSSTLRTVSVPSSPVPPVWAIVTEAPEPVMVYSELAPENTAVSTAVPLAGVRISRTMRS